MGVAVYSQLLLWEKGIRFYHNEMYYDFLILNIYPLHGCVYFQPIQIGVSSTQFHSASI